MSQFKILPTREIINFKKQKIPQGISMVRAPLLWRRGILGKGVVVAVIDTGCQENHPDLRKNLAGGFNFVDSKKSNDFSDGNGHGTHVAGIIAAGHNKQGIMGVAPRSKLLILKALSDEGVGGYDNVIQAIKYAIKWRSSKGERVRIISMSLGGKDDSKELRSIIQLAVRKNILVVCAAGNSGDGSSNTDELLYPGVYPEVVQVGATTLNYQIANFSNSNREVDLVAPGSNILSTYPNDGYRELSGTSMAAPHVAGAAALLIDSFTEERGLLSINYLVSALLYNTQSLGYHPYMEGYGLLRFY